MDLNPGSQLTRLRLRGNLMDELPVLPVIAHGLESLVLSRNVHFSKLSPQTLALYIHVKNMLLEHCLLGHFPDFCPLRDTHVAPTLNIRLENNSITFLNAASVKMHELHLDLETGGQPNYSDLKHASSGCPDLDFPSE